MMIRVKINNIWNHHLVVHVHLGNWGTLRPSFGGFIRQNRGQTGSRYIFYVYQPTDLNQKSFGQHSLTRMPMRSADILPRNYTHHHKFKTNQHSTSKWSYETKGWSFPFFLKAFLLLYIFSVFVLPFSSTLWFWGFWGSKSNAPHLGRENTSKNSSRRLPSSLFPPPGMYKHPVNNGINYLSLNWLAVNAGFRVGTIQPVS